MVRFDLWFSIVYFMINCGYLRGECGKWGGILIL